VIKCNKLTTFLMNIIFLRQNFNVPYLLVTHLVRLYNVVTCAFTGGMLACKTPQVQNDSRCGIRQHERVARCVKTHRRMLNMGEPAVIWFYVLYCVGKPRTVKWAFFRRRWWNGVFYYSVLLYIVSLETTPMLFELLLYSK